MTRLLILAALSTADVRAAAELGLRRVERGAANYVANRTCFSCHHQTTAMLVFAEARRRGVPVAPGALDEQADFAAAYFRERLDRVARGEGLGGGNTMAASGLAALDAAGRPADEDVADALVEYLLRRQRPDGSWPATTTRRPPTEGSPFANAALALAALRRRPSDRVATAVERGTAWATKATPNDTEDAAGRLASLGTADARAAVRALQRADGSWGQTPDRPGDAYATATALLALRPGGDDPAYRKGVAYLLSTQSADGSWLVETRAVPVQTFFDNGDPGGKSQFLSFAATAWATLVLLRELPEVPPPGGPAGG